METGEEEEEAAFVPVDEGEGQYEVLEDLTGDIDIESDEDEDEGEGDHIASTLPKPGRDDAARVLRGHSSAVFCVAWGGGVIATGGGDDKALLWSEEQAEAPLAELGTHTDSIADVAVSSDGELVAAAGLDGTISVCQSKDGSLVQPVEGPGGGVEAINWHPKGPVLVGGSEDYNAYIFSAKKGDCMAVLSGHAGGVTGCDFALDGRAVVTTSADGTLRLWAPKEGKCVAKLDGAKDGFHDHGAISCLRIVDSPDRAVCITGGEDGEGRVVAAAGDIASGNGKLAVGAKLAVSGSEGGETVECADMSATLPLACLGGSKLRAFDANNGQLRCDLNPCDATATALRFSPKEPHVVAAGFSSGIVRAWDARSADLVGEFVGHENAILDMSWHPSGSSIVTASDDGTSRVFDIRHT